MDRGTFNSATSIAFISDHLGSLYAQIFMLAPDKLGDEVAKCLISNPLKSSSVMPSLNVGLHSQ